MQTSLYFLIIQLLDEYKEDVDECVPIYKLQVRRAIVLKTQGCETRVGQWPEPDPQ